MKLSGYGSCKQAEAQEGFQGSHFSIKVFMLRYAILKKHLGCIDKDPAVGRSWGVLCSLRSAVQAFISKAIDQRREPVWLV